jgi:hypothetical protein
MKYEFVGWCREGNADKVWGIIVVGEYDPRRYPFGRYTYLTFWGRRGKALRTKIWVGDEFDAKRCFYEKLRNGYHQVDEDQLDKVYPEFEKDLEKIAVLAILAS